MCAQLLQLNSVARVVDKLGGAVSKLPKIDQQVLKSLFGGNFMINSGVKSILKVFLRKSIVTDKTCYC